MPWSQDVVCSRNGTEMIVWIATRLQARESNDHQSFTKGAPMLCPDEE